jgi:hypothetical protein
VSFDDLLSILGGTVAFLFFAGFLYFWISTNTKVKRRIWPFFVGVITLFFIVFVYAALPEMIESFDQSIDPEAFQPLFYIFLIALPVLGYLQVRNTKFCSACGKTHFAKEIFIAPRYCSKCGAEINGDGI